MFRWDDLRFFLALARGGSGARAAESLGVNQSTVSRRIAVLESDLGVSLFDRNPEGARMRRTGERLYAMARQMEELALAIDREYAVRQETHEGVVRVTTVEEIATLYIAPALTAFHKQWPGIKIELLTGIRTLNLAKREADISLRVARPARGDLFGRKVGEFGYGVYAADAYLKSQAEGAEEFPDRLDWIFLENVLTNGPEEDWFRRRLQGVEPVLRCSSFKTQIAAVLAGLGVALLPRPLARLHGQLQRLPIDTLALRREIWLAVHRDMRHRPLIQVVMNFLTEVIQLPPAPTAGKLY